MKEYWRTVVIDGVEHPRYQVSNFGKVKCLSWRYTGKERICKLSYNGYGYLEVGIDGVSKLVHRLVATAFLPCPNPERNCIDHKDTDKTNNVVILDNDGQTVLDSKSNLRWVSHKENSRNPLSLKHMSENAGKPWLGKFGAEHHSSIPIVQLTLDGQFIRKWPAGNEAGRELVIDSRHICSCCKGKRKSAGGFKWMYATDYNPVKRSISNIKPLF